MISFLEMEWICSIAVGMVLAVFVDDLVAILHRRSANKVKESNGTNGRIQTSEGLRDINLGDLLEGFCSEIMNISADNSG